MNLDLIKPINLFTNDTEIVTTLDTTFEVMGYFGGGLLSACLIPQIIKIIKTQSGDDLSYTWQILSVIGLVLFLSYGIYFNLLPVYIPVSFELTLIIILIILKYYYEHNKKNKISKDTSSKVTTSKVTNSKVTTSKVTNSKVVNSKVANIEITNIKK